MAVLAGNGFVAVPPDQPDLLRFEREVASGGTIPSR